MNIKNLTENVLNFQHIDTDITVWFILDSKKYEVSQFNISFGQSVDHKGQPQQEVRGGRILVSLTEALPESVYQWAMTSATKNGEIVFRISSASSPLKILFANAYCVNLERKVNAEGGINTVLVISPEELNVNGIDFDNRW